MVVVVVVVVTYLCYIFVTALDIVERLLSSSRFIADPGTFTEADLRLFMTLVRFDEVYVVYFKCNVRSLSSYRHIQDYMREIYQLPGMADTISMEHIKMHYFSSHPTLNPYAVIPQGPNVIEDLKKSHFRMHIRNK